MGFFTNLFGGKAPEPVQTTEVSIQKLRETEELLLKKQLFLEKKIEEEIQTAVNHGKKNQRQALQALKRKKQHEKSLAQIDGTLQTLEFQIQALENASTNTEVMKTMKIANDAMKAAHNNMDLEKVHDLMEDISDQQAVANEIADAIGNPSGFGMERNDDDLLAELMNLEQEELGKQLIDKLPSHNRTQVRGVLRKQATNPPVFLPDTPSYELPGQKTTPMKSKNEMSSLENWVAE